MDYLTIALVLIAAGVILLGAEVLLPTGGFLVVGALIFFAVGVGTIFYYGDTAEAAVALGGLAVGLPAVGVVAVSAWRRMSIGNSLNPDGSGADVASGEKGLRGRIGKAVTPLRPSGTVEIDGRRVDAMTEGMMIEAGTWVRCVDLKPGRIIVRVLDSPADLTDIQPGANLTSTPEAADDFDLDLGLDRPN